MSSSADFPAKMFPSPETARAWEKARVLVFGSSFGDLLGNFDPEQSSLRTPQGFSLWGELQLLETLEKWAIWDESGLYRLLMSEHPISEIAFGLWPTPSTTDSSVRKLEEVNVHETANGTIRFVNSEGQQSFARLSQVVSLTEKRMWATPQKFDAKGIVRDQNQIDFKKAGHRNLREEIIWSTLAKQDAKNATLPASQATRDTLPGDLMNTEPDISQVEMNPDWEEILMGLPPGWTDLSVSPAIETNHNVRMNRLVLSRAERRMIVASVLKRSAMR